MCNNDTQEVGVLNSYCLTSNGDGSNSNVVGRCLAAVGHGYKLLSKVGNYKKVLPNITEQEAYTCDYLNHQGRLCGQCKPNHTVSAYSYDITCHPCTSSLWSCIVQYICIVYLTHCVPLYCVSISYQNHFSCYECSSTLLSTALFATCLPIFDSVWSKANFCYENFRHNVRYLEFIFLSCIYSSNLPATEYNAVHCLRLPIVALYPLLCSAHDKGCRLVVRLWRPFLWCTARLRQQWNRHSIIDAFSTFSSFHR